MPRKILPFLPALLLAACATAPAPPLASVPLVPVTATFTPAPPPAPRDAFVLLSGGGTPLSNNYSQFLQARALNDWFRARHPAAAVWTFFGAGNRTGQPPVFADARRQLKQDGLLVESWVPGALTANRPATRDEILAALKNEILPRVAGGGTLWLFVGDHGELSRDDRQESAITLWQMERQPATANGWRSNPKLVLTVTDLRAALRAGLGRGRVIFCLTCCHSGGFHHLGVPRTVAPNPAWFARTTPVECADWTATPESLRIAGYTATTEDSLAAGCAPDPDPDQWAGYERFLPEALLGTDLFTGARHGAVAPSFAAAHAAATVVDHTIDKPYGSAEALLERYAALIEKTLAPDPAALAPAARAALARYEHLVADGAPDDATDADFVAQQNLYARFLAALAAKHPADTALLTAGARPALETAIGPVAGNAGAGRPRGAPAETRKLWTDTIRPAWKAALTANQVPDVPPAAREFELALIGLEEKTPARDLTPGRRDSVLNEVFWRSSYAIPAKTDPARATAVARWEADRRRRVLDWAHAAPDPAVSAAAVKWGGPARPSRAGAAPPAWSSGPPRPARKEALQRALFQRRVLGAWAFLLAVDEQPALAQVRQLLALQRTPLPPG